MTIAALTISALANAIGLWSLNHQRLLRNWARDKFNGPIPKLRQIRYHRPPMRVSTANAENQLTIHLAGGSPDDRLSLYDAIRREVRRRH